jgi:hypothetical protein
VSSRWSQIKGSVSPSIVRTGFGHETTTKVEVEGIRNVLHVPDLDMPFLSCRVHRRRGQGCSFVADAKGCFLTFPTFFLKIDDTHECALPCGIGPRDGPYDYEDAPDTRRSRDASNPPYLTAKRAIGAFLSLPIGKCCRVSRTSTPAMDPALISTILAVSPRKPQPATTRAREPPPVLPCETPKSSAPSTKRYTPYDLHRLFGGRKLPNFKILAELGTGIEVKDSTDPLLSVCDVVNLKCGHHGKLLTLPKAALDVVGMDIGYGDGVSPGGYCYCLMLVNRKTRKTWVYDLPDMGGNSLCDALWRFFIDARGSPVKFKAILIPNFFAVTSPISTQSPIPERTRRKPLARCLRHGPGTSRRGPATQTLLVLGHPRGRSPDELTSSPGPAI